MSILYRLVIILDLKITIEQGNVSVTQLNGCVPEISCGQFSGKGSGC